MTELARLQGAFQRAMLTDDDRILDDILDGARTSREALLDLYRNAYAARFLDCLSGRYGHLRALMGAADFEAAARAYLAARPSRSFNLKGFGADLSCFLDSTLPYAERRGLAELAAIEGAMVDAIDAANTAPSPSRDHSETADPSKNFPIRPHPSVRRLNLSTNAYAIWSALDEGLPPPDEAVLTEPDHLIVWRRGFTPALRRLLHEEAVIWDAASGGASPGALCESLAERLENGADACRVVEGFRRDWLDSGLVVGSAV